ncbi:MAG: YdcF family protein [Bdellovibrionia bacterium]
MKKSRQKTIWTQIWLKIRLTPGLLWGLLGAGSATVVLLSALFLAGEIYHYSDTIGADPLPEVDAIVCLAGGRGRITAAGDLWYRYLDQALDQPPGSQFKIPTLYFAGLGHQANWNQVSRQMNPSVLGVIQPEDVMIEKDSTNTDANARWLLQTANERQWKRIILLTSSYHMRRAQFLLRQIFQEGQMPLEIETYSVSQEPFTQAHWSQRALGIRVTLLEYFKWLYYQASWSSKTSSD